MTSRDYREEYSSNVVRTLHPSGGSRPLSPPQHHSQTVLTEYDSNLDYLLDDLQSSVSRPGSSLEHHHHPGNYSTVTSANREVTYLSPSNERTVIRERSVSPMGDNRKVYKTAHYEYSTTSKMGGGGGYPNTADGMQHQNVNQLDTLLSDLKHERDTTLDRKHLISSSSNIGIDDGLLEPSSGRGSTRVIKKTTKTYSTEGGRPAVNRELVYEPPEMDVQKSTTVTSHTTRGRSPNYQRNIDSSMVRDVSLDVVPVGGHKQVSTTSRTVNTSTLPQELTELPTLNNDIMPMPGTKVTTTIKTYTYEIPAAPGVTTTETTTTRLHNSGSPSSPPPIVTYPPERDVSNEMVVYKSNNTTTNVNEHPHYPNGTGTSPYGTLPHGTGTLPPDSDLPPGSNRTYYYKHESNNTTNTIYKPQVPPPTTHITQKTTTTTSTDLSPQNQSPYPYPNQSSYPNSPNHYPANNYPNSPNNNYPNEPPVGRTTTVVNHYTSTHNNYTRGGPNDGPERQPLLHPAPFPVDGVDGMPPNGSSYPPKRVDDLMASFSDDTNYNHGRGGPGEPFMPRKEINTALATGTGKPIAAAEPKTPSKNVAGPPVYYPPGKQMFAGNGAGNSGGGGGGGMEMSSSQGGWRSQGGYAKGSGRYEYESASKSKSSSKSGGAVVPVCLPLCCAMPCTIM